MVNNPEQQEEAHVNDRSISPIVILSRKPTGSWNEPPSWNVAAMEILVRLDLEYRRSGFEAFVWFARL